MYFRCLLLALLCGIAFCNPFESHSNDLVSRMRRTTQPSIKDYCYSNCRKYHDLLDQYGIWAIIAAKAKVTLFVLNDDLTIQLQVYLSTLAFADVQVYLKALVLVQDLTCVQLIASIGTSQVVNDCNNNKWKGRYYPQTQKCVTHGGTICQCDIPCSNGHVHVLNFIEVNVDVTIGAQLQAGLCGNILSTVFTAVGALLNTVLGLVLPAPCYKTLCGTGTSTQVTFFATADLDALLTSLNINLLAALNLNLFDNALGGNTLNTPCSYEDLWNSAGSTCNDIKGNQHPISRCGNDCCIDNHVVTRPQCPEKHYKNGYAHQCSS